MFPFEPNIAFYLLTHSYLKTQNNSIENFIISFYTTQTVIIILTHV